MLPVTVMILSITSIIGGVATAAAIRSSHGTGRDANVKRAIAAAAAGVKTATYRLNMVQPTANQCVTLTAGTLATVSVGQNGWCPPVDEQLSDNSSYSQVTSQAVDVSENGQILARRRIVSTGIASGVKRRILVYVTSLIGRPLLPDDHAIVSLDALSLNNSVHIDGHVGSNGNVTVNNNSEVCGNIHPGPGRTVTFNNMGHLCPGYSVQPTNVSYVLEPVDQGNAATVNDNHRIGTTDPWTSSSSISWNSTTRNLSLSGSSTLTLTGNVYSFCRLQLSNSAQLLIATKQPGSAVRIYIDSPDNCGGSGGTVSASNLSSIHNLNAESTTLQLYLLGSPTRSTSATFSNAFTTTLPFVIYAPRSTVSFSNGGTIRGAIAAKTINLSNSVRVIWDTSAGALSTTSVFRIFRRQQWIECTSEPASSAPDSGC